MSILASVCKGNKYEDLRKLESMFMFLNKNAQGFVKEKRMKRKAARLL